MDISAVRAGIAAAAADVVITPALTATGYVPDSITEPHFFTAEVDIAFDKTHGRGCDELTVTCRVLVGRADDRASQKLLDSLLAGSGTTSLKAAIEAARGAPGQLALDGEADDLHVVRVQGYRWYEHAGTKYVGAELIIHVIGSGS